MTTTASASKSRLRRSWSGFPALRAPGFSPVWSCSPMCTSGSFCAATWRSAGSAAEAIVRTMILGVIEQEKADGNRMLWLNWSGGGNLPPSLGVARVLTERGHPVTFAGRPEMVPRVKTAGFRAIEITEAYAQVDRYPQDHFMTRAACYLTSPAVEAQIHSIVAAEAPDIVLIDAMFPAALAQAPKFDRPTAVFVHTFVFRQLDMWRRFFGIFDDMRQKAGFRRPSRG